VCRTSEFVARTTPRQTRVLDRTMPTQQNSCLPENNHILLRSKVATRNPMPLPEIRPRMFPVQSQQYVGDEYPRGPVLRSASPTSDPTVSKCCETGRIRRSGLSCKSFLGQDLQYG
jgi:hypothetical protein